MGAFDVIVVGGGVAGLVAAAFAAKGRASVLLLERAPEFGGRAVDIATVTQVLRLGQSRGSLGTFDAEVLATLMKAALDDLLTRYADDPGLDLEAYGAELVGLFERAARPGPAGPGRGPELRR